MKDTLYTFYDYPESLCYLCFMSCCDGCDDDDENDDININMILVNNLANIPYNEIMLCNKCKYLYSKKDVLALVQDILNESYKNGGKKLFDEFIEIFKSKIIGIIYQKEYIT